MSALTSKENLDKLAPKLLWLASGFVIVAAGLVMWWARGERVFADLVSASFAWCM